MKKIFIVGNSRSGTTMLGRILNRANQINTFGELHFFEQLVSRYDIENAVHADYARALEVIQILLMRSRLGFFHKFEKCMFVNEAKAILESSRSLIWLEIYDAFLQYETKLSGKSVACEQTPRYLFTADLILDNMPDAYVVNLIRDPRDVVISQQNKWKRRFKGGTSIPLPEVIRSWANYHPFIVAKIWNANVSYSKIVQSERLCTFYFEDLVTQPEKTIAAICEFIDEKYSDSMLNVPLIGSSNHLDNVDTKGIDKSRANGWKSQKINRGTRELIEFACKTEMEKNGYSHFLKDGKLTLRSALVLWNLPVKLLLGLLLNLRRYKNIRSAYIQRFMRQGKV